MKRLIFVIVALLFAGSPVLFGQGILLPQDTRIAPFPHPMPGPHPLRVKSLDIQTRIVGQVATTRINQVFANDLAFVVDGTFFYPLPEDATFIDFATWEGEKKLHGEVLERDEARNRYLAIVRKCWDPGLLEYAGANLFQARVFPVPARGEKRIEFAYSQVLRADHGLVSYVYPLQSGGRANPQQIDKATIVVDLQSNDSLKAIYSPTHTVDVHRDGDHRARLSYEGGNLTPDRNFQLFYSISNADFGLNLVTYREASEDGYFMLILSPKLESADAEVVPKDILFVLDTSGSMQERGKLEKARAALQFGVRSLRRGDRFNIVTFSTDTRKFRDGLVPATEENRNAANVFIERQVASGGTNIGDALKDAFASLQAGERPRYLVFMTDGLPTVGETDPGRILKEAAASNNVKARVFTFGVGYDVNTFLLDQLAARNFGTSDYITPEEDLEVKLSNFFAKVSSPVLTAIELQLGGLQVYDLYPRQPADIFRGSQITVLGRYSGSGTYTLGLKGTARGQLRTLKYEGNEFPALAGANDFLPRLWAMRKVGFLLEQIRMSGENAELRNEIVRLAKKYGFVTPYTSYLAADERDLMTGNPPPRSPMPLQMSLPSSGGVMAPVSAMEAEQAVYASRALTAMKAADVATVPDTGNSRAVKKVGSKTFRMDGGTWTDSTFDPAKKLPVVELRFGSEAMLSAIASDHELASFAALGKSVIVVHKGKVYRIG